MSPRERARAYVIREGSQNIIVHPDGTRIVLAKQSSDIASKAQYADALWIVEHLLSVRE